MSQIEYFEEKKEIYYYIEEDNIPEVVYHMLQHNQIHGLLPLRIQYINNQICFIYSVHGYIPISKVCETNPISAKQIVSILLSILDNIAIGEQFFLSKEQYAIDKDYLFFDRNQEGIAMCLFPEQNRDFFEQMKHMMEFFLEHLNHEDSEAVKYIYTLYEMITDSFTDLNQWKEYLSGFAGCEDKRLQQSNRNVTPLPKKQPENIGFKSVPESKQVQISNPFLMLSSKSTNRFGIPDKIELLPHSLVLGRQDEVDIQIKLLTISRIHARLEINSQLLFVEDMGSTNGTFLNGKRLTPHVTVRCKSGDVIGFAGLRYVLYMNREENYSANSTGRLIRSVFNTI